MIHRAIRRSLVLALIISSAVGFTSTAHAAAGAPTGVTVVANDPINAAA